MSKRYSNWSAILGLICAVTIFISYTIAPQEPEGVMVVLIQVLFFTSIITGLLSLIFSYMGFKNGEKGFLKMVAPITVILIVLAFLFSFLLMINH